MEQGPSGAFRVLIVRAGALGDTLMTTPLIRELRHRHPNAEIDFLASAGGAELLATNPHLSRRLVLRQRNVPYFLSREKRKLVQELRSQQYNLAVLLEAAPRYRKLVERARVRHIRDFGTVPFNPQLHSIVNNLRVGGFEDMAAVNLEMELPCPATALESIAPLHAGLPRPLVAIHSGYGPSKKKKDQTNRLRGWSTANFAHVAQQLVSQGASIVLTGSPEDLGLCNAIASGLPSERYRILAGRTNVMQFVAAIKSCDLLISVDSASAHIAAAVGTPVVVLWGPAIFDQTRPLSRTTPIVILRKPVPCAPCYGTELMKTCKRNICMEQIEPGEVIEQAMRVLNKQRLPVLR